MTPEQVAASYDRLADQWLDVSTYGFAPVERAVAFATNKGSALDVGCGTGRLMALLNKHGFRTDGLDVSPAMIALARDRHPDARLFHADICRWELPRPYDLIVAWDSVWHVPLAQQEAVLTRLCRGLEAGGVLVFSMGGTDAPDEKQGSCMGPPMAVTVPRSAEAFDVHWANVLPDPTVTAKAILLGEEMINVSCFQRDGQDNVGYWVSREHWGKGIVSRALHQFLLEVATRPLYAHVATSNGASLRVLQKCGFVIERVQVSPASERHLECEEAILVLTGESVRRGLDDEEGEG